MIAFCSVTVQNSKGKPVPELQKEINPKTGVYFLALVIVIASGIASRLFEAEQIVFDKYLGDALYAAMVYLMLRIGFAFSKDKRDRIESCLWFSVAIVFAIEVFQLTGIPLSMRNSENALAKLVSTALGTKFGLFDLIAYGVGLIGIFAGDAWMTKTR